MAGTDLTAQLNVAPLLNTLPNHPLLVMQLDGGKIVGDLRLVATASNTAIGGLQLVNSCESLEALWQHHAVSRRRFRLPRHWRGTALLLSAANGDNYYHWLLDSLPRWHLLQAAGWTEYDHVLLHSRPRPFQDETLTRLGIPRNKRQRPSKNFVHQFERLVVPAMPFPHRQPAPWACDWLRSLFPKRTGGLARIYITRRQESRRRLANEAALEARLTAWGFVAIQPENYTVAEQASLFASAECIVAAHGAGLTNLVFAPRSARVVELFHPDILRPTFRNLAAACGQSYTAVIGQRTRTEIDDSQAEFVIDVKSVLDAIENPVSAALPITEPAPETYYCRLTDDLSILPVLTTVSP